MYHLHDLSRAVQADREREIRLHMPLSRGLPSGPRHPDVPESGVVEPGPRRFVLRREPKAAFGV